MEFFKIDASDQYQKSLGNNSKVFTTVNKKLQAKKTLEFNRLTFETDTLFGGNPMQEALVKLF